ncbi:MAG: YciI family protein [Pelagimonas sp.]|uniref:YciI family protein n=1 Tax=Pelagimonas sp. TaxID=2073170 RepID=UPI003D6BCF61
MTEPKPEDLYAKMLRQTLFVITTTPARGPGMQELLPAHLEYQIKMERDGILFGAGPLFKEGETTPYGGMIIVRAKDEAEARAHADLDPFHVAGLRQYTLTRWMLNEGGMTFSMRYSDQSVVIG